MLTVVETAMLPIAVAVETAGASQTHQALERALPFGEKSIFNSLATLFDVIRCEIQ